MFAKRFANFSSHNSAGSQSGVTLVELVIAIVIIAIAAVAILSALASITQTSSDPLLQTQATAIAESYLEEILVQPFIEPTSSATCDTKNFATDVCPAPSGSRTGFNNVCDYNGLVDTGVRNQFNQAVASLSNYNVEVSVQSSSALNGLAADDVLRVRVSVINNNGSSANNPDDILAVLDSYKVCYE